MSAGGPAAGVATVTRLKEPLPAWPSVLRVAPPHSTLPGWLPGAVVSGWLRCSQGSGFPWKAATGLPRFLGCGPVGQHLFFHLCCLRWLQPVTGQPGFQGSEPHGSEKWSVWVTGLPSEHTAPPGLRRLRPSPGSGLHCLALCPEVWRCSPFRAPLHWGHAHQSESRASACPLPKSAALGPTQTQFLDIMLLAGGPLLRHPPRC